MGNITMASDKGFDISDIIDSYIHEIKLSEEIPRQCAWCRAIYNKETDEWEPYSELVEIATHGMCPECFKREISSFDRFSSRIIRISSLLDVVGRSDIADMLDRFLDRDLMGRTAMSHGPVPDDFVPRVISEGDLPEDAYIMYHATTDLDGVSNLGLVSHDERRDFGWPDVMGIGGGSTDLVSLTRKREIAEAIAGRMKDMREIASSPDPRTAVEIAEGAVLRLCLEYGIDFDAVISEGRRMYSSVMMGNKSGDAKKMAADFADMVNGVTVKRSGGFKFPTLDELPDGSEVIEMWPYPEDSNKVFIWKEPLSREEWLWHIVHYFDYMLNEVERRGGPASPMFWSFDEKRFLGFDPENVGVVDVLVTAPPERGWDKEYHPDWKSDEGGLNEWAGRPENTRVIKRD